MNKLIYTVAFTIAVFLQTPAQAQYAAQNDAKYLATIKAVADYKINDEENLQGVEALRQNRAFNEKLQKMLNKLSNKRTKDTTAGCCRFWNKREKTSIICWINLCLRKKQYNALYQLTAEESRNEKVSSRHQSASGRNSGFAFKFVQKHQF